MANDIKQTYAFWETMANKQAYDAMKLSDMNADSLPENYDPIYGKLIEQISDTIYHKIRIAQMWYDMGSNHAPNAYPGIMREIYMLRRKGQNFGMDATPRPTTLNTYPIIDDKIDVRYHSAQFRWMYGWTLFDEELRRFSGGTGETIAQLAEMKAINATSAHNIFMDQLRKKTLNVLIQNIASEYTTDIDISDYDTLTPDKARAWLNMIDNLCYSLQVGTALYNGIGEYMQTPKARLQVIIPYAYYNNVMRKAFPDMYNSTPFENIMPSNMIKIDNMGSDVLMDSTGTTPAVPTFDASGKNLLDWKAGDTVKQDSIIQCVIMDSFAMGFEENLNQTLVGTKDIEKLATPVRMHYWNKAYVTDTVTSIKVVLDS